MKIDLFSFHRTVSGRPCETSSVGWNLEVGWCGCHAGTLTLLACGAHAQTTCPFLWAPAQAGGAGWPAENSPLQATIGRRVWTQPGTRPHDGPGLAARRLVSLGLLHVRYGPWPGPVGPGLDTLSWGAGMVRRVSGASDG